MSAAIAGLRFRIPYLHRIAAPASALLVLNTAAICALYKFLFTRGPLFEIWTSNQPQPTVPASKPKSSSRENRPPPPRSRSPLRPGTASMIGIGKTLSTDSQP